MRRTVLLKYKTKQKLRNTNEFVNNTNELFHKTKRIHKIQTKNYSFQIIFMQYKWIIIIYKRKKFRIRMKIEQCKRDFIEYK